MNYHSEIRKKKKANFLHSSVQKFPGKYFPTSLGSLTALAFPLSYPPPLLSPMTPLSPPYPLCDPPLANRTSTRNLSGATKAATTKTTTKIMIIVISAQSPLGRRSGRRWALLPEAAITPGSRSTKRPSYSGVKISASHSGPFSGHCLETRRSLRVRR